MDQLIVLVLALLVIAVVLTAIVLPIVAIVFSVTSRRRIARLENRLERIEAMLVTSPAVEVKREPTPPPRPEPTPPPPPRPTPTPSINAAQLESVIGRRWVGWAAVVVILFATAFFLKYAFDNR